MAIIVGTGCAVEISRVPSESVDEAGTSGAPSSAETSEAEGGLTGDSSDNGGEAGSSVLTEGSDGSDARRDGGKDSGEELTHPPDAGDDGGESTHPSDAGDGGGTCQLVEREFEEFVEANLACSEDEDCTIIGDCGPHVDWRAIHQSAAVPAYALMLQRCSGVGWDGPIYGAECEQGQCVIGSELVAVCGMAPDAGF